MRCSKDLRITLYTVTMCEIHGLSTTSTRCEHGNIDLKDCHRLGQLKGGATKANIAAVEGVIKQDASFTVTVKEIAKSVDMSS